MGVGRSICLSWALFAAVSGLLLVGGSHPASAGGPCDQIAGRSESPREFVQSLGRGDVGCFRSGRTYRSTRRPIAVSRPAVTLTTQPGGERARLVGRLWVQRQASRVTVSRLRLDGRNKRRQASPTVNSRGAVFAHNSVTNHHTGICFLLGNPGYGRARGTVIRNNRIHDCGVLPATNHDHGIYLVHARNTLIRGNWIHDNADRGIQLYPDASGTMITRNVIDGNGQAIIFSGSDDHHSAHNTASGNVISYSRIRFNVEAHWQGRVGSGNVVRGNCLWAGSGSRPSKPRRSGIQDPRRGFRASGNIVAKPRYVSRRTGDYRLRSTSRCLDIR